MDISICSPIGIRQRQMISEVKRGSDQIDKSAGCIFQQLRTSKSAWQMVLYSYRHSLPHPPTFTSPQFP